MDMKLLWLFVGLNIVNVIVQTIKSIATLKCGKVGAAIINAIAFGFYTIVTVYMLCDLPLMWKAGIVALCNLVGVYIVKWGEEKARKDKLWKVEATAKKSDVPLICEGLLAHEISYNCTKTSEDYRIFNIYCPTQKESAIVRDILAPLGVKYFVSESEKL